MCENFELACGQLDARRELHQSLSDCGWNGSPAGMDLAHRDLAGSEQIRSRRSTCAGSADSQL